MKGFSLKRFQKRINSQAKHVRSIKIVVAGPRGRIEIPLTKYEIYNLCELFYMCDDECNVLKLNKVEFGKLPEKIEHIEQDIIGDGKRYTCEGKPTKEKHYLIKKPNWKK